MFNSISYSVISQLSTDEEALFAGLETIGQDRGRIYKKQSADGTISFFQAEGFWSRIYHFIFSKRIAEEDIVALNKRVEHYIEASTTLSNSAVRVEAIFDKILRQVLNNSTLNLPTLKSRLLTDFFSSDAHYQTLKGVASKLEAREKESSMTGQPEEVLTQNELYLLEQFAQLPLESSSIVNPLDWEATIFKIRETAQRFLNEENPVMKALKALENNPHLQFSPEIMRSLKAKVEKKDFESFSPQELTLIINAKKARIELQNVVGSYLKLDTVRQLIPGLNDLFDLSTMHSHQINETLLNDYYEEHHKNFNEAQVKKSILVQGAGPNGLMATLKLYMAGANTCLINNRGEEYTRAQILRLDPKWVAELHYYLGKEFDILLSNGTALMKPSGYVEIPTNILEDRLKDRLAHLWSRENAGKESKHMNLRYTLELKSIDPQIRDGAFQAHIGEKGKEASETMRFDTLILAGGAHDEVRNQYLCPSIRQSSERLYSVSILRREVPDTNHIEKYADKEDFRGVFEDLVNNFSTNFDKALQKAGISKEAGFDSTFLDGLAEQAKGIKGQKIDYRFFENPYQLYLGLQYPHELADLIRTIERAKQAEQNKTKQKKYDELLKVVDQQLRLEAFKELGMDVNKDAPYGEEVSGLKIDKSSPPSRFPVSLTTTTIQAKTIESDGITAFISVAGDSLTSPHFFSGSGLSSGRTGVNNLVASMADALKGKPLEEVAVSLNQKQIKVVQFTLQRGAAFTPLLNSTTIQINSHDTTVRIVEEAMKKGELALGVKIEKQGQDQYTLNLGDKQIPFTITLEGKLMTQGREFIVLSDLMINQIGHFL